MKITSLDHAKHCVRQYSENISDYQGYMLFAEQNGDLDAEDHWYWEIEAQKDWLRKVTDHIQKEYGDDVLAEVLLEAESV